MKGKVEILQTEEDIEELFRLRYQVFVEEEGNMEPKPDEQIYDGFDKISMNIAAIIDGNIVGGLRLTAPSESGIPADEFFDFHRYIPEHPARCGGGSMLCISRKYRRSINLIIALNSLFFYWGISTGLTHIYGAANPVREPFFVSKGYRRLSPPFYHEKKKLDCLPVIIDLNEIKEPYLSVVQNHIANHGLGSKEPVLFDM
ncbi:GNAT family N-acetyltransferase [Paenibacillus filicis]|uniref:GNAT family N-acetyltransferase n=1 Tax=Paenibacillus gyeongsangnamensis TaxID=3388067 RepID=A0ABT4QJI7_9BACL|nr:GNAT family N-acyltransferase [Paenibacillus filicis]MCZ8516861.1 GNAT family N-acetyltransferase [Paenibacillus filicis]